MADSLGDFAHLYELFSTCPTEEDVISFEVFNNLFALKADPLRYLIDSLELFAAGPTEKSLGIINFIQTF